MTIAVTPFDGLCGFRPLAEIAHFLTTIPALSELVGGDATKRFIEVVKGHEIASDKAQMEENKKALQNAFTALMKNASSSPDALHAQAANLVSSARELGPDFASGGGPGPNNGEQLADLVVRLDSQFPSDV